VERRRSISLWVGGGVVVVARAVVVLLMKILKNIILTKKYRNTE
jgi:hypothetical protein